MKSERLQQSAVWSVLIFFVGLALLEIGVVVGFGYYFVRCLAKGEPTPALHLTTEPLDVHLTVDVAGEIPVVGQIDVNSTVSGEVRARQIIEHVLTPIIGPPIITVPPCKCGCGHAVQLPSVMKPKLPQANECCPIGKTK